MTRIRKSPEERKQELLEVAFKLFVTNGYGNTTVGDICKEVGVAKSTFFYHFSTKEEILEKIMSMNAVEYAAELQNKGAGKSALAQFQIFLDSFSEELPVEKILDKIENSSEFKYMSILWESIFYKTVNPFLQTVFTTGLKEGAFSFPVEEIPERLRFLWSLLDYLWYVPENQTSDDISDGEMDIRVKIVSSQLEKLMGLEPDVLEIKLM